MLAGKANEKLILFYLNLMQCFLNKKGLFWGMFKCAAFWGLTEFLCQVWRQLWREQNVSPALVCLMQFFNFLWNIWKSCPWKSIYLAPWWEKYISSLHCLNIKTSGSGMTVILCYMCTPHSHTLGHSGYRLVGISAFGDPTFSCKEHSLHPIPLLFLNKFFMLTADASWSDCFFYCLLTKIISNCIYTISDVNPIVHIFSCY